MYKETAIIIPSLEPDKKLIDLLTSIKSYDDRDLFPVIIINDGSPEKYNSIFERAASFSNVKLLGYEINRGKGFALKTAFNYILKECPKIKWVATIDSDGQHTIDDTVNCVIDAKKHPDEMIFGSRNFSMNEKHIPLKSNLGNIMTSKILKRFTGLHLNDTQTGLRVIPRQYLKDLLDVEGDRFEYEMNMILYAKENKINIREVPISTIYINENESSHFKPVSDSFAIYSKFLKYIMSSLIGFFVDISMFTVILKIMGDDSFRSVTYSTVGARIFSSTVNYLINRYYVFKKGSLSSSSKYIILMLVQMISSSVLVTIATNYTAFSTTVVKVLVDCFLFFCSFMIQKKLVFKNSR